TLLHFNHIGSISSPTQLDPELHPQHDKFIVAIQVMLSSILGSTMQVIETSSWPAMHSERRNIVT
ncbi:hypothetical protein A2U01_0028785, partial [Trifolium medium]|nr:hypothetical protein [Trifolium medium]